MTTMDWNKAFGQNTSIVTTIVHHCIVCGNQGEAGEAFTVRAVSSGFLSSASLMGHKKQQEVTCNKCGDMVRKLPVSR